MQKFKPSASMIVAVVALFVALTGGAYAASTLTNGSVTHPKLSKSSVWHANLGRGVVQAVNLAPTLKSQLGVKNGTNGTNGSNGNSSKNGANSNNGANGTNGPAGPSGVNSPLVYSFSGASGPDSGDCGNSWATDTYDATFIVTPQADGSYTIAKVVKGRFVTIAGVSTPNPMPCPGTSQTGGVRGTFYGTESWSVAAPMVGQAADFDPFASCGAACSPTTTGSSSSEAQNLAFQTAFFPGSTYSGVVNFDFVYNTASHGSWVDSNTPTNNTGNING